MVSQKLHITFSTFLLLINCKRATFITSQKYLLVKLEQKYMYVSQNGLQT